MAKARNAAPAERGLPMLTRAAPLAPGTIDEKARTVELVWSTGASVRRVDFWDDEYYDEELSLDPAHVDLSRLSAGAPLLNAHNAFDLAGQIGVVERAWIVDGAGRAVVRFSEREEVEPIWRDVTAGIIRNVSVGYQVRKFEIIQEEGKLDLYRAVDWTPLEISLVPVPADAGATVREREHQRLFPCQFVTRAVPVNPKEGTMTKTAVVPGEPEAPPPPAPQPSPPVDANAVRQQAIETERRRGIEIRARSAKVGLPAAFADDLIQRGVALEHVGDAIVDELAKRGAPHTPAITGGADHTDPVEIRESMVEALAARATQRLPQAHRIAMSERGQTFAHHSLLDLCADLSRARGERVETHLRGAGLYDRLVGIRALSTSDFPILLADAGNKILVKAYELAQPTYRLIFGRKEFTDFKPHKFIRGGDFPVLLEVGESGEYKFGAMSEAKQEVGLATYGRIIGISRRLLINDDLGAFSDLPTKAGRRVADWENATAWTLLGLNGGNGPTIAETNQPLYHAASHKNLAAAGGAISVATVGPGRAAMMKQESLDKQKLNIMPRYLLTSPDKFTEAEQFASTLIAPAQDAQANPFKGKLIPVGDANLTGIAWHLYADPADLETLIYGYLQGAEGPRLSTREGFTTDGVELKVSIDFGFGAIDYRGAYKNPGA